MEDTTTCLICQKKLRTIKLDNTYLPLVGKSGSFSERTCSGPNHSLQFYTNKSTKLIELLRFSLDHKYTRYLEVDYFNKRCRIYCMKNGDIEYINIPKMVELDFPDLEKLKEKISTYVTFS